MLLKTNTEKMSDKGPVWILLKTNKLKMACVDIDEKNGDMAS
jgi:hypothetical protein